MFFHLCYTFHSQCQGKCSPEFRFRRYIVILWVTMRYYSRINYILIKDIQSNYFIYKIWPREGLRFINTHQNLSTLHERRIHRLGMSLSRSLLHVSPLHSLNWVQIYIFNNYEYSPGYQQFHKSCSVRHVSLVPLDQAFPEQMLRLEGLQSHLSVSVHSTCGPEHLVTVSIFLQNSYT